MKSARQSISQRRTVLLTTGGQAQVVSRCIRKGSRFSSAQILGGLLCLIILALIVSVRFGLLSADRPESDSAALPLNSSTFAVFRTSLDHGRQSYPELRFARFPAYNAWAVEEITPGMFTASCYIEADSAGLVSRVLHYTCLVRRTEHGWRPVGSALK